MYHKILFAKIVGYLIKLLRSQGMPERKLHEIFVALIVSRICYALSALSNWSAN